MPTSPNTNAGSRAASKKTRAARAGKSKTSGRATATPNDEPAQVAYASDLKRVPRGSGEANVDVVMESPTDSSTTPLSPVRDNLPLEHRGEEVLRLAEEAFAKTGSWVVFYRWMLSPGGVVDQLFDTAESRRYFELQPEFEELLEMLTGLRSQDTDKAGTHEPERVITVRMPRSLHESVIRDADDMELSVNKYCLTKLLQPAGKRFTPLESGFRRGRRPGPQIIVGKMKVPASKSKSRKKRSS